MRSKGPEGRTGLVLIHGVNASVPQGCATCAYSRFIYGNLHYCQVMDENMDEDDDCENWCPIVIGKSIFGVPPTEGIG